MLARPLAIAVLVLAAPAAAPAAQPPALRGDPSFVITGHGYGHGVGMSQYGAYGYAQRGFGYRQIVTHYYPGTQLGAAPVARVRVLLGTGASTTISSGGAAKVKDGAGRAATLPAGTWKLTPSLRLKLPKPDAVETLATPLTFTPTTQPLQVNGRAYRGSVVVASGGKKLTVVNSVGLEQYLYGVVASEMPSSWHPEALKAQAVVARSYALALRKPSGAFDLYDDSRSQAYGGIAAEKPSTTAAVDATAGEVLFYGGKVAVTYFSSSSGGRTESIADAWNSQPVPYLVSVADPYDSISPYHNWGPFAYTGARLDAVVKAPGRLTDVETTLNGSGRVATLTAHGTAGDVTLTGAVARRVLGLRSTWFRVGVLALDPLPKLAVPYGGVAELHGTARALAGVTLETRPAGTAAWSRQAAIKTTVDGTFALPINAAKPAQYRLTSGTIATSPTTLVVAPSVKLALPTTQTALGGAVRPAVGGAPVQIQRAGSGRWSTVARASTNANGAFTARFAVTPGTYRARFAPTRGWAASLSPELRVVGL